MESLSIPVVRKLVRSVSYERAFAIGQAALRMDRTLSTKSNAISSAKCAPSVWWS